VLAHAKRFFILIGWAGFSASAVVAAVVGEGDDRIFGIAFALFVVVGVPAVWAMQTLNRPRQQAIRREVILFQGTHREAIVCHYSRRKQWAAFVGSCAVAIGGVLIAMIADTVAHDTVSQWMLRVCGIGLAFLFAGRAAIDVYRRWGSGHYVALLPEGLLHQAIRPIFVPWTAVETAGVFEWQRMKGAGVLLRKPDEIQAPWWVRRNMRSNRRYYGFDLVLLEFEASPEDLAEAIQRQLLISVGPEKRSEPPFLAAESSSAGV
jgi:hypothetical protein